jgi:hypothetical protein
MEDKQSQRPFFAPAGLQTFNSKEHKTCSELHEFHPFSINCLFEQPEMKRYFETIDVVLSEGHPAWFSYHAGEHSITGIEEIWILQGNWWILEEKRTYYRVLTNKGLAVIFFRQRKNLTDEWILEQIFD